MITNFFSGLAYFKKGGSYLLKNRSLFKFIIPPTLINLALFFLLGFILFHYYTPLFDSISSKLGGLKVESTAWWTHLVGAFLWFVKSIIHVLLGLFILVVLVVGLLFFSQIINGPFYDLISEAVEIQLTGAGDPPFSVARLMRDIPKIIILELKKLILFVSVPLVMLLLNLIPVLGSIIYTLLSNMFAAWSLGFNYVSYTMSRKLIPFSSQIKFAAGHKARVMGLGVWVMIPLFNLLFAPIFVIGGTLLYLEHNNEHSSS
ncbi:EI24 domain-containing protein [bacterium]|nr:EI24 domain-containing protein [bacterium]